MTWSVRTLIAQTFISRTLGCTRTIALVTASTLLTACTTSSAGFIYKDASSDVRVVDGPLKGKRLGYVTGEAGGYGWSSCTARAKESLAELLAQAKARGANAVNEVIWDGSGDSIPSCRRIWPFAALWPLLLTPMFMNTRVEAVAYQVKPGELP